MIERPLSITFAESILKQEDFSVFVDEAKLRGFFVSHGVRQEFLESTHFSLKSKLHAKGYYHLDKNDLAINLGFFWDEYSKRRYSTEGSSIVQVDRMNRQVNKTLFHEAKHLMDRESHPKLLKANQAIMKWGGLSVGVLQGWMLGSMLSVTEITVIYTAAAFSGYANYQTFHGYLNFFEWRARKFADQQSKLPEWGNIITLIPR